MWIPFDHDSVRLTGRWGVLQAEEGMTAVATAAGATMEIAFRGELATMRFDMKGCEHPYPHLWIRVDGGAAVEAPLNAYLRVKAPTEGEHSLTVVYKGAVEAQNRWFTPLVGRVAFFGLEAEDVGTLSPDLRKTIEFVGDSITEGVLIDEFCRPFGEDDQPNRPSQDDVTATYAWLTAQALHLRPLFMGYGAVGLTQSGQGSVPAVGKAYPYCFDGMPVRYPSPDYVLINHGANDRFQEESAYIGNYRQLLDMVIASHPQAQVIVLSPFCGAFHESLGDMVAAYNRENHAHIVYVDTAGWIPAEPLHPHRDGHRIVAEHLTAILKTEINADY